MMMHNCYHYRSLYHLIIASACMWADLPLTIIVVGQHCNSLKKWVVCSLMLYSCYVFILYFYLMVKIASPRRI